MAYIVRLTRPENNNKFYIKKPSGYNPCILGNIKYRDSYLTNLPNCVGYAFGRFHEIFNDISFSYYIKGNAEDLYKGLKSRGLSVGKTPHLGAMIIWRKGKVGNSSDGAGHIAIVEKVISDTEILVSESGWKSKIPVWTAIHKKGDGNWTEGNDAYWMKADYTFLGFVYNPYPFIVEPDKVLEKGDIGYQVRWIQIRLNTKGYFLEVDGIFGGETERVLKDYQRKCLLPQTGKCDSLTLRRLRNTRR